jgi:hypothetical protein
LINEDQIKKCVDISSKDKDIKKENLPLEDRQQDKGYEMDETSTRGCAVPSINSAVLGSNTRKMTVI